MYSIFIHGSAGTTGLQLYDRLKNRRDISLMLLPDQERRNEDKIAHMMQVCDIAFLCLPDDVSKRAVELARGSGAKIIDASTAHRTAPGWAYGMPELSLAHRNAVSQGTRISVPGCHASGFVSLIYPLVQRGLLPKSAHVSCTSLTGYSGGGKSMIEQYEKSEGLQAPRHYALGQTHKHLPEMTTATGLENTPHFMPIVGSFFSGMCVSIPLHASQLAPRTTLADVQNCLQTHYKKAWMVSVVTAEEQGVIQDGFLPADALHGSDKKRLRGC